MGLISYVSFVMRETLNPPMNMINPMIGPNEIRTFAENNNAEEFNMWCENNGIPVELLDVNLTNPNEGYYNVELFLHDMHVMYNNGVLQECNEL